MNNIKKKVEAVLFAAGNKLSTENIRKLCKSTLEEIKQALAELKKEYDEKDSSIMLVEEGDFWKFTIREQFISIVRKIVTETELSKSVLETLAVIAFKYPIKQSDLIKIRTNKSYEHLVELEKSGYISRQKFGRTNLIKLTDKFFQYFDLSPEKLREQFKSFEGIAQAIKQKEQEVETVKGMQKKAAEEAKNMDEKIKEDIENLDKQGEEYQIPVKVYESPREKQEEKKEQLLGLEVVDESLESEKRNEENENTESNKELEESKEEKESDEDKEEREETNNENEESNDEKEVEKEVDKMMNPKEEDEEKK